MKRLDRTDPKLTLEQAQEILAWFAEGLGYELEEIEVRIHKHGVDVFVYGDTLADDLYDGSLVENGKYERLYGPDGREREWV